MALAVWRGYANLVLDMTKYVGTWTVGSNKAQVRHEMRDMADVGEIEGMWMAHETDAPSRDAFPTGWEDIGGGLL